jgi:NAD-specific glutamate dehydrogenase
MSPVLKEMVESKYNEYVSNGVTKDLARRIANLIALAAACDIVKVAKNCKLSVRVVGEIYFSVGTRLSLGWLRMWVENQKVTSYWDNISQQTMINSLYDQQRRLTAEVTKTACNNDVCSGAIESWERSSAKDLELFDRFLDDLKGQEKVDNAMLVVAMKRLESINAT